MTKEDLLEFDGTVLAPAGLPILGAARQWAQSSRLQLRPIEEASIRILAGDRVTMEMTPYDLSKGRICSREKKRAHSRAGAPADAVQA